LLRLLVNDPQVSLVDAARIAIQRDRLAFGEVMTGDVTTASVRIEIQIGASNETDLAELTANRPSPSTVSLVGPGPLGVGLLYRDRGGRHHASA
jgi:hypothetical protein